MSIQSWLNRLLFSISTQEASFARRGFPPAADPKRAHLEHIGRTFISGYLSALQVLDLDRLLTSLNVAQGAAFAAKARLFANNPTAHTEIASRVFCGMSASEAASITDSALAKVTHDSSLPDPYAAWRAQIREELIASRQKAPSS